MTTEITIEEIKDKVVHSELLKAIYLINQARNIVSDAMDETELRDAGLWDCLDETVCKLNNCANDIGYIVVATMNDRIEALTK